MFARARVRRLDPPLPLFGPIAGGAVIAGAMTVLMTEAHWVWSFLVLAALLVLLPTLVVTDVRLYWAGVFLFTMPLEIKKTLLDGLEVKASLGIDYIQPILVPEVRLSDLALAVLVVFWLLRWSRRASDFSVPAGGVLALAYLGWAGLSIFKAPIPYLSAVEWVREAKFFLVFLCVANCIDSKRWLRLVAVVLCCVLLLQAGMTIARSRLDFGFLGGEAFGRAGVDLAKEKTGHLVVAHSGGDGAGWSLSAGSRSFGTVPSPAGTAKHIVMLLPLVLLLPLTAQSFRTRCALALLGVLAVGALFLTFSRAGLLGLVGVAGASGWLAYRPRLVPRPQLVRILVAASLVGVCASPFVYSYWNARRDNLAIRFEQYQGAFRMIAANPLLGVGLNNSPGLQKQYTPMASSVPLRDPLKSSYTNPIHNYFLTLAAETGVVGLLLYLGFFGWIVRCGLQGSRSRDRQVALFSAIGLVGLAGLAASVVGDPLYEDPLLTLAWFYAGLIVAMTRLGREAGPPAVKLAAR